MHLRFLVLVIGLLVWYTEEILAEEGENGTGEVGLKIHASDRSLRASTPARANERKVYMIFHGLY